MAALTGGGDAPEWLFHHSCCGGYACAGGCYGACYGSCYGGCYGGYGGYGCWGCWGCSGGGSGCYGGDGGWGGGYGVYGGHDFTPYTGYSPVLGGVTAPGAAGAPGTGTSGDTLPRPKEEKENGKNKDTDKDKDKESMAPNRARLIVELPAGARLYVDDRAMKVTSTRRTFHTPELELGQAYYYELRAEVVRDGKPVTETRRVIVRAGDVVRTRFSDPDTPVTTAQAR
jgi:uncharacterized protein (TIGR03000 family)